MPVRWRSDAMRAREATLRVGGVLGAACGYGCLAAFLGLVGMQIYSWLREREWTHVSMIDGTRAMLAYFGVSEGSPGRAAALAHWLDAPIGWLGLHKVLAALPASLALFAISAVGNCIFIYASDRLRQARRG